MNTDSVAAAEFSKTLSNYLGSRGLAQGANVAPDPPPLVLPSCSAEDTVATLMQQQRSKECPAGFEVDALSVLIAVRLKRKSMKARLAVAQHSTCTLSRRDLHTIQARGTEKELPESSLSAAELARLPREDAISHGRRLLTKRVRRLHLQEVIMEDDGNCLFRAVSHQLFGSQAFHLLVRQRVVDQLQGPRCEEYLVFFDGDDEFDEYVQSMGQEGTWGDEICLTAIANAFRVVIYVLLSTPGNPYLRYVPGCNAATLGKTATRRAGSTVLASGPEAERVAKASKKIFLSYLSPIHYNSLNFDAGPIESHSVPPVPPQPTAIPPAAAPALPEKVPEQIRYEACVVTPATSRGQRPTRVQEAPKYRITFEHQRRFPVLGWTTVLHSGDPPRWTTETGAKLPGGPLPATAAPLVEKGTTDGDGWSYSYDFPARYPWASSCGANHHVRRRRWAQPLPTAQHAAPGPEMRGYMLKRARSLGARTQKRYFTLEQGRLAWKASPSSETHWVDMRKCVVFGNATKGEIILDFPLLKSERKRLELVVKDPAEHAQWMEALNRTLEQSSGMKAQPVQRQSGPEQF
eukprot:TRINITY_DN12682_c0_g1_i1.p1 TRINITY_DN12682_c0_g1~~TRINITY_DN12682_c0_g1_i1.p1  ORF type:complete len:576 (-),score=62.60 TRINITY_DN12682_c0_g1_i1:40-1767(-)